MLCSVDAPGPFEVNMKNNVDYITEEEARDRLEKLKDNLAKRGILFDGSAAIPEIEFGEDATILGPQTELSYRRLLKEMKDDTDDGQ